MLIIRKTKSPLPAETCVGVSIYLNKLLSIFTELNFVARGVIPLNINTVLDDFLQARLF